MKANKTAKTIHLLASKAEAKKECMKLCTVKALEAKCLDISISRHYLGTK